MEKRRGLTGDTSSKRWFFQCYISFCGCITKNRQRENPPKSQIVQKSVAYVCFVFLSKGIHPCVTSTPPFHKRHSRPFFITWFPRPGHIFGGPYGTPGFAIVDMCADLKRNQGWKDGCLVWFFLVLIPKKDLFFQFLWWVGFILHETRVWFVFTFNFNFMRCGLDHWRFWSKNKQNQTIFVFSVKWCT